MTGDSLASDVMLDFLKIYCSGTSIFHAFGWVSPSLFLKAIPNPPFTLGVALPTQYDLARVVGGIEVTVDTLEGEQSKKSIENQKNSPASGLSSQGSWAVHPDWLYCRYNYGAGSRSFGSQEERVEYFLRRKVEEGDHFHWRVHRYLHLLEILKSTGEMSWAIASSHF